MKDKKKSSSQETDRQVSQLLANALPKGRINPMHIARHTVSVQQHQWVMVQRMGVVLYMNRPKRFSIT